MGQNQNASLSDVFVILGGSQVDIKQVQFQDWLESGDQGSNPGQGMQSSTWVLRQGPSASMPSPQNERNHNR